MTAALNRISSDDKQKALVAQFESMIHKTQPGFVKALSLFRANFGQTMGLAEVRIINRIVSIVLPFEIKKIENGKLTYSEFKSRNGLDVLDNLIEEERKIIKKAFFAQGFSAIVNADYSMDREVLRIVDRDVRHVLEEEAKKLKYSDFISKHTNHSLQLLGAHSLDQLMKNKSYLKSFS